MHKIELLISANSNVKRMDQVLRRQGERERRDEREILKKDSRKDGKERRTQKEKQEKLTVPCKRQRCVT